MRPIGSILHVDRALSLLITSDRYVFIVFTKKYRLSYVNANFYFVFIIERRSSMSEDIVVNLNNTHIIADYFLQIMFIYSSFAKIKKSR